MSKHIQLLWDRYRLLIIATLVLTVMAVSLLPKLISARTVNQQPDPEVSPSVTIMVDIEGAVAVPGIRELPEGSLVADALQLAGGLTEQADTARVARELNRADKLKDHQKLYIPLLGESVARAVSAVTGTAASATQSVDLNTASQSDLEALPGVGPSTAQKIIEYRESQPFGSVDELQSVPGIGPSKFNQLKDLVSV